MPTSLSTVHGSIVTEPYVQGTQPTTYDDVDVEAKYVVIDGKKYLATTKTPAWQVHTGVFIKLPTDRIPDWDHKIPGGITDQSQYLVPTQPDPRGGQVLDAGSVPDASNPAEINPPTGLSATFDGTEVDLTWQPVDEAVQYNVYRSTSPDGPFTKLGSVQTPSYTDTNLPADGGTLYYEVFAESNTALSTASQVVEVQLPAPNPVDNGTGNNATNGTSNEFDNGSGNLFGNDSNVLTQNGVIDNGTDGHNSTNGASDENGMTNGATEQNSNKAKSWIPGLGPGTDSSGRGSGR